ncbi:MAG: hypothetical protein QM762_04435 [Chryseolinea sp.]
MRIAHPVQNFQDWFTQQWVILWGRRIEPDEVRWLMGPFGKPGAIADDFVIQLAQREDLTIETNAASIGLLSSIDELKLSETESACLSKNIMDFYVNTSHYKLKFSARWNPMFRVFGNLVTILFSNRIKQLSIPTKNIEGFDEIDSQIITLKDRTSGEVKYTIWYRRLVSTGQVLYSGVYSTCILPSGKVCIKAVFPLPNGNATVIMTPSVGPNGELRLDSSGQKFGDAGFYFLLNDSKGGYWSQYIQSFRDHLNVYCNHGNMYAEQNLTLWRQQVVRFNYEMHRSNFSEAT